MPNCVIVCSVEDACVYMLNISKNKKKYDISSHTMVRSSDACSDDASSKDTS
jgi:hypothetical protein